MKEEILIVCEGYQDLQCESVIVIPEIAIKEPGYIKVSTVKDSGHAKHEYHAMAQTLYFQFQDDELELSAVDQSRPIITRTRNEDIELERGMVIARTSEGELKVFVHAMQNQKKLLETAYRYCTRWIRLDI